MNLARVSTEELVEQAVAAATPVQLEKLAPMLTMGWRVTKIIGLSGTTERAIALCMKGTAAWLLPCGKLERAKVGQKTAWLDLAQLARR